MPDRLEHSSQIGYDDLGLLLGSEGGGEHLDPVVVGSGWRPTRRWRSSLAHTWLTLEGVTISRLAMRCCGQGPMSTSSLSTNTRNPPGEWHIGMYAFNTTRSTQS